MKVVAVWLVALACCVAVHGGTLYGLGAEVAALETIDPVSGKQTPIGIPINSELTAQQLSSIDSARQLYYMVAYNTTDRHVYLIALSLTNGQLTNSISLPFTDSSFIGVGQSCDVMPENGNVLVSGRDRILDKHHILQINPVTKQNTVIASIGNIDVLGGASAYDPVNKVLWLQYGVQNGGIYLFAFQIPSGKILFQIPDTLNFETMNFDTKTGLILGIGLQVFNRTSYNRVLMSLDSKTSNTKVIATIPNYFIIEASIAALNSADRELYCFLQPIPYNNTTPFNLLTINADTGAIKNSPAVPEAQIPWSIAYYATSEDEEKDLLA